MIPKIIHFTIPTKPSAEQLTLINRTRSLHPGWEVKVWQDPLDPSHFRLANYWPKVNSGAQLADLIRLEVVFNEGGFYLDSDMRMEKNMLELTKYDQLIIATEDGQMLTNAFFGAPKGCKLVDEIILYLLAHEPDWSLPPNLTTGPLLFTKQLQWRLNDYAALPKVSFYPYNWNEAPKLPQLHTYATHLWHHSWKGLLNSISVIKRIRTWIYSRLKCFKYFVKYSGVYILWKQILAPKFFCYSASEFVFRKSIFGPTLKLIGCDLSITPHFTQYGYYEINEEAFVFRTLKSGDHFVDVGANVGIFSLIAAGQVGKFGRVHCFEPNPEVAECIRHSLVMNWVHDRVIVNQVGLGAHSGAFELRFSGQRLGDASLADTANSKTTFQTATKTTSGFLKSVTVEVTTLDEYFKANIAIKILKIDAEGFECEVLDGADRLLNTKCFEYIIIEAIEDAYGHRWPEFCKRINRIVANGYRIKIARRDGSLRDIDIQMVFSGRLPGRNIILQRL